MSGGRPGMRPERLVRLVRRAVEATELDLRGCTVLTEAATGAYVVTPVIAAVGGAGAVHAVTRASRYGTVDDVERATRALAELAGVSDRITVHDGVAPELVGAADVVTNSGHLRPIDARMASWMRPGAVVPLMFEAWEIDLGRDDVDLGALRARGVRYAGTNERHPCVGVFDHLGPMAVVLLTEAAIGVLGATLLVVCDNPFEPYLVSGLRRAGAHVTVAERLDADDLHADLDAIVVALRPRGEPVITAADVALVAERAPGAVLAQFWGDLPRDACAAAGVPCAPEDAPPPGHMGVLPSAVGPEPIVRLQTGGLKVASILLRPPASWTPAERSYVDAC